MKKMTDKEQILSLISGIDLPGAAQVVDFMENSDFFTINCRGHHFVGEGGVARHSLEVRDYMLQHNVGKFSEDSITLLALCHDLGKSKRAYNMFKVRRHDRRSLMFLESCGIKLGTFERNAILTHSEWHSKNGLWQLLRRADKESAKTWEEAHPKEMEAHRKAKLERARKHHSVPGI